MKSDSNQPFIEPQYVKKECRKAEEQNKYQFSANALLLAQIVLEDHDQARDSDQYHKKSIHQGEKTLFRTKLLVV